MREERREKEKRKQTQRGGEEIQSKSREKRRGRREKSNENLRENSQRGVMVLVFNIRTAYYSDYRGYVVFLFERFVFSCSISLTVFCSLVRMKCARFQELINILCTVQQG